MDTSFQLLSLKEKGVIASTAPEISRAKVVGPPVCGFYAGLYNGYKADVRMQEMFIQSIAKPRDDAIEALPREAATCLWGAPCQSVPG